MLVLFVWGGEPSRGAPHHLMAALWLQKNGVEVEIVAAGSKRQKFLETPIGALRLDLITRSSTRIAGVLWQLKLFRKLLSDRIAALGDGRTRLYYIQGHLPCPAATFALLFVPSKCIVYHTQDFLEPGRHRVWALFERRLCRVASAVIVNDSSRGRVLQSLYGLSQAPFTIPTALPRDWPMPRPGDLPTADGSMGTERLSKAAEIRIAHYGPLLEVRCGRAIAEAVSKLGKGYKLILTGVESRTKAGDETLALIDEYRIEEHVEVYAGLSYCELHNLGSTCSIAILLYPNDGIGNFFQAPGRLTEYLRVGTMLVLPDYPGFALLNQKFNLGTLCDPTNAQSIANAILKLSSLPTEQQRMRRHCNIEVAINDLSYDTGGAKLLKALGSKTSLELNHQ